MFKKTLTLTLFFILFIVSTVFAGALYTYPKFKAFDSNGDPLSGGKLHTYIADTTTNKATYSNKILTTPNTNPIILDSYGEAVVYGTGQYKFILYDVDDNLIWSFNWIDSEYGYLGPHYYFADASLADQGVAVGSVTVKDFVDGIAGTVEATIAFTRGSTGNETTYTFLTSENITDNFNVIIENGVYLSDAGGTADLVINKLEDPGVRQIFDWTGTGNVTFGSGAVKEVYPRWWGDVNDNIIKAYASITIGRMFLPNGTYTTTQKLTIKTGADVIGESQSGVIIEPNAETFAAIEISTAGTSKFQLENFTINYGTVTGDTASTTVTALGINLTDMASSYAYQFVVENISIKYAYRGVQDLSRAWHCTYRHVRVTDAGDYGFYFYHASAKAMITLDQCAVGGTAPKGGFYIYNVNCLDMRNCSVNNQTGTANFPYYLTASKGSMVSCNSENNTVTSQGIYHLNASTLVLSFPFSSGDHLDSSGGEAHVYYVRSGSEVTIISPWNYGTVADSAGDYAVIKADENAYCTLLTEIFTVITGAGNRYVYWVTDKRLTRYRKEDIAVTDATVTVSTGEDDLESTTIGANTIGYDGVLRIFAAGRKTGANGNKTIKLHFGGSSVTVHPAVNNEYDWRLEAEIFNMSLGNQRISWMMVESDSTTPGNTRILAGRDDMIIDTTAAVILKLTGECAHTDDVITQNSWIVERL